MSLRVRAPLPAGDVRRSGGAGVMEDPYMSRLVKLVPAEAIGPFPFLMEGANRVTPDGERWAVYFVAWILLLIVVVVRWRQTMDPGGQHGPARGAQWGAILIAAVAYVIWVHVMNGDFGLELLFQNLTSASPPGAGADAVVRSPDSATAAVKAAYDPSELKSFMSSVSLMAWTTLAPVVYRGDEGSFEQ